LLAAASLRADDRLIACELRPDDGAELAAVLRPYGPRAEVRLADGYAALAPTLRAWRGRALVLIDPPFERGDDYPRIAEVAAEALVANPGATILVWTPLKDLETFDALLRALEDRVSGPGLAAELRLRPLLDPLRLNGCGLIALNPPAGLEEGLEDAGAWIATALGEPGGGVRLRHLATAKRGGAQRRGFGL
jgi:23S rRNA (adenine2030-N6)-methyltransferase